MLLLVAGFMLVALIMTDVIWTTLTTFGSGVLTGPVTVALRKTTGTLYQKFPRRGLLMITGPLTIVVLSLFWILGLWLGWLMVFNGLPNPVVEAQSSKPADLAGYIYYVGFTLSTLGVGDFRASGDLGRLLTSLAAFNGLIMVTLGITYAVPLVSGSVQRRKLAFTIAMLGCNPAELVARSWSGQNFNSLESLLSDFTSSLIEISEQRLAYPVLDDFHSRGPEFSLGLQLAILDESLSLMAFGLEQSERPDPVILNNSRRAISHYLSRIRNDLRQITTDVPELPKLESLEESGLTLKSASDFRASMESLAERRKVLHQLVLHDGWRWSQVSAGRTDPLSDGDA